MPNYIVTGVPPTNPIPLKVLNPKPENDLNYDYGYQRKRPVTHLNSKARAGAPNFRELTDAGHSLILNWADRPLAAAEQLKQFYEQYRGGVFIVIDHEAGGREYVGRFTTPVEPVPTRPGCCTVQSVQFDEVPGVPMRRYPTNWDRDAIWFDPIDFDGNVQVTTSGGWTIAAQPLARVGFEAALGLSPGGTNQPAPADATSWAQMQYAGYGFQLWSRSGPDMGEASVWLDGVQIGTIDFYSAVPTASAVVFLYPSVPLGVHRVKILSSANRNAASSGNTIVWDSLRVMR